MDKSRLLFGNCIVLTKFAVKNQSCEKCADYFIPSQRAEPYPGTMSPTLGFQSPANVINSTSSAVLQFFLLQFFWQHGNIIKLSQRVVKSLLMITLLVLLRLGFLFNFDKTFWTMAFGRKLEVLFFAMFSQGWERGRGWGKCRAAVYLLRS